MIAAVLPPGLPDPLALPVPLNAGIAPPHSYAEYYAQAVMVQPVNVLAPYMAQFQADNPFTHQLLLDGVSSNSVTTPRHIWLSTPPISQKALWLATSSHLMLSLSLLTPKYTVSRTSTPLPCWMDPMHIELPTSRLLRFTVLCWRATSTSLFMTWN
jgi:hypothetical protein